jgi:transposase
VLCVLFYADNHFTVKQISDMMDVSMRTIERRLRQFNLQVHAQYSTVSYNDLHALVLPMLRHNPQLGWSTHFIVE